MGRPRQFDETEVLDAMTRLFWEQGFKATSYAQLVKASGLGESSLYAAFGNKEALFRYCLGFYLNKYLGTIRNDAALNSSPRACLEAFWQVFTKKLFDDQTPPGCFFVNTLAEAPTLESGVQELIADFYQQVQSVIRDWFKSGLQQGEFPADLDPSDAVQFYTTQLIGVGVMARFDKARGQAVAKATLRWLRGLR